MPNIQVKNSSPSIKNVPSIPNSRVSNLTPSFNSRSITINSRVDSATAISVIEGQTSGGTTFGGKGYLIGMMALTYTSAQVTATSTTIQVTYVGPKPNIRINNI